MSYISGSVRRVVNGPEVCGRRLVPVHSAAPCPPRQINLVLRSIDKVMREDKCSHAALKQQLSELLNENQVSYYRDEEVLEKMLMYMREDRFNAVPGLLRNTENSQIRW